MESRRPRKERNPSDLTQKGLLFLEKKFFE